MVGISTAVIPDSITLREMGTDAIPATPGEVFGAAFGEGLAENLTPRMVRSAGRFTATTGIMGVDDFGRPIQGEAEPLIDTETANSQYGIKGHLSFDQPVPQSVAKDLFEHKRAQLDREDTIARRESGLLTGGAARFTAALAAGTLDPLNVAVGFIPVIGPAREALLLEQAASAAGRAAIRAGVGAASGAAGMAALQPFEFGLSKQEHEDYTMAMALRSVALGTVLGGGLHAGIGAVVDRATGKYRNPLAQRLEEAGPEARETLLQGALAQHLEERPVEVAPALDAMENAAAARLRRIDELTNDRLAAERGELANGSPVRSFSAIAEDDARAGRGLRVAAQDQQGEIYIGQAGQTHADLLGRIPSDFDEFKNGQRGKMGFTDAAGNFLTREEAALLRPDIAERGLGGGDPWLEGVALKKVPEPLRPVRSFSAIAADESRAPPKFTFEREAQRGPIERETNTYSIRDAAGAEVARTHLIIQDGGSRAYINFIDSAAEGEPGRILGPAMMRDIGRAFFETFPDVQELAGQRVSGARFARDKNNLDNAETVTVTRAQLFRTFAEAVNDLTSAARRAPEISDTTLASREAAKVPNDELQAIENHNAELESRRSPAGAENAAEPGAVDPVMELAEARARAYERAGACLTRGG